MRIPCLLALMILAAPAFAAEQEELVGCFDALTPYSRGFGESIGQWEWAPPVLYPTVVVPSDRGKTEGLFVYSEDKIYFADFQKVPRGTRTGWMRWFPFALGPLRDGRGVFRCSYRAQDGEEKREVQCDLGTFLGDTIPPKGKPAPPAGERYYHPIGFTALESTSRNRAALRTAVLSRIMSVTASFAKGPAAQYARALKAHQERMNSGPSALSQAAGYVGLDFDWNRNAPAPPDRDSPGRALRTCAAMRENDQLAEAARTELALLSNYPVPR